jgi:hypothetical protein
MLVRLPCSKDPSPLAIGEVIEVFRPKLQPCAMIRHLVTERPLEGSDTVTKWATDLLKLMA